MPPERRTGPSYIHAGWCGAMSKEAAHISGVCPPSRTAALPAPGGGKRTRRVYTEGILLCVWLVCCSKVFLWAVLTQPGGEFNWSKPVRAKSKG